MAGIVGKFLLMFLIVMPSSFLMMERDGVSFVGAQEDELLDDEDLVEGEDDEGDVVVETDEGIVEPPSDILETEKTEEEEEEKALKPSPNAETYIHFTKPVNMEFPAGEMVRFLVGFTNVGESEFLIETMDASFRYPQDYTYYIQNFTAVRFDRTVEPSRQATFEYAFTPSESFSTRPFGLTVNLNYKDAEGKEFQDAVFNETINIIEPDEGLDGETFFLYVFLAAVVVLLFVGIQQLLASFGKKHLLRPKSLMETGTQNKGDVDYDWIPKQTLNEINKSPGSSPRQSPGRRRAKRNKASTDE